MLNKDIVISVRNVSKTFKIKDRNTNSIRSKIFNIFNPNISREIKALNNINLEIKKGEFFGIIGKNGSGKSTLLKIMCTVYLPDKGGEVEINGDFQRLALGTGFDMELTARENVYLNASLYGLSFKRIGTLFSDIIQFAELEQFVDTKLKFFSTGMISRLAFSIAVHVDAEILFLDEFGGVGDVRFREKSDQVFKESIIKGKTIVYVSHELNTISEYCDRVLLLDNGNPTAVGKPKDILEMYYRNNISE